MAGILYHQFRQLNEVQRALKVLSRAGFGPATEAWQGVYRLQGGLMKEMGMVKPKPMSLIKLLMALSPGSIKLFHDAECGWLSEAREKPGAPPVYHYIDDDAAMKILRGEMTHELEAVLMKRDEYLGE